MVIFNTIKMTEKRDETTPSETLRVATSGDIEVATYLEIAKQAIEKPAKGEAVSGASRESIVIFDFGSQYSLLIARRIRELHVYCELVSHDTPWEKIAHLNPKGFILSGGPASVYTPGAPMAPAYIYESKLPIMGI